MARDNDQSLLRIQYLQRPPFTSKGYVDQDFSGALMVGKSVLQRKEWGITALFGGGYAWGYIRSTKDGSLSNSYSLPGPTVAIDGRWSTKGIDVRLTHQVLVGHNSKEHLNAYVVWPFNWFVFSVSSPVSL